MYLLIREAIIPFNLVMEECTACPSQKIQMTKLTMMQCIDDVDDETMARYNTLSRRLYRILLRSCTHDINGENNIDMFTSLAENVGSDDDDGTSQWVLLQPPMDQRKYGFAKIVQARRGDSSSLEGVDISSSANAAVAIMSKEDVGMAMEVLRFVHVSLGGDADDELDDYYLGLTRDGGNDDDKEASIDLSVTGAAAGRHSEGHYTQFLDDDEERGEGDSPATGEATSEEEESDEWDSDDDVSDEMGINLEADESVLVTTNDIRNAIRIAFRAPPMSASLSKEDTPSMSTIIPCRHRDAINACQQLSEQFHAWDKKSSISIDLGRGVRVVATSSLMMRPAAAQPKRYRFSYRVRVENIIDILDSKMQPKEEENKSDISGTAEPVEHRAVQLLGRTWIISERGSSSSALQRLVEKRGVAVTENGSQQSGGVGINELRVTQTVNEPRGGAVGHLPVLGPGEVFEYMSGADIATPSGALEGCFHMASVDMQNTDSAHVGDPVEALQWKANDERRFEMPVGRFGFVADDVVDS